MNLRKTNKAKFLALKFLTMSLMLLHWQASQAEDAEAPIAPLTTAQLPSEDDYLGDAPRVLTVSRLSQSLADSPSAVTIIDRETIRAAGIIDLPEVFRLVPGFYVATNAGFSFNTNHAVSYHGISTAYPGSMQILINGRSVYSPLFGGVNWSELPIAVADIERIEITRGPNAASYGANAFFGTVNIITQSPSQQAGASISATYGDGRREAFMRYAGKVKALNYRVSVGYRDDDGLKNRLDFKRTRLLNAQADYQVNDKNNVEFEFGIAGGDREEGAVGDPLLFKARNRGISNHFELLRWRHNISDTGDFSLQAYHSTDRSDDTFAADLTAFQTVLNKMPIINNDMEFERYDIEAQHNFSLTPTLRGVWGGSLRTDKMYAPFYLGTSETDKFDLQRLFGHAEWSPTQQVVFNAGAMLEHNDFTGTDLSPRASVNFKINPNHTVRLGISTALRTPNYLEEKFNTGIASPTTNPRLTLLRQYFADTGGVKPEKLISKEIGYLGNFGQFSIDTRLFRDDISDSIQVKRRDNYVPPPGLTVVRNNKGVVLNPLFGVNGGEICVQGFEAQAKWHIASDTNLLLNYAYVNIDAIAEQTDGDINESAPKDTISALFTHSFNPQWDASYAYYHTSAVTALGDGEPVKLARRSDVRLARKFNAERVNGEASLVVENLFNEHYNEFALYNVLKRRVRLNVRLDF